MNVNTRKLSEKDYHDKAFSEGTRAEVAKYYSIAGESRRIYRSRLESVCPGKRALEYGCGPESYAFVMARKGAQVTGIDISGVAIEQVKQLALQEEAGQNTRFLVMDAEALEFPDAEFDLICGTGILHHLDLSKAYTEVERTLKSDGCAIFIEPLGHNPFIRLYRALTPRLRTPDEHPLMMRDIQFARAHFANVEVIYLHCFCLLAVPFRKAPFFRPLLRMMEALDRLTFKLCPFFGRYAWMAIMLMSEPRRKWREARGSTPLQTPD